MSDQMQAPWYQDGLPHIWLPYTQMKTAPPPLAVVGAQGCRLILADGRELIDGIASWWSVCHGYNHPQIRSAVEKQLSIFPHVMFGGLVHEQALTLAKRLSEMVPGKLPRVFFSDSGSTAVEVALKMALQYWKNTGKGSKNRFICFRNGYHGDTLGAMGVSDPEENIHKAFRANIIMNYVLDIPRDEYSFAEFEELLKGIHGTTAGLIIEPLVQGAGGMRFHSADILAEIARLVKHYDILFIADEIATGFGRTGSQFACEEAGIIPNILCLGKALTGGTLGLAATLASEDIFDAFKHDDPEMAFMHGPTYMGNALACAAANASLDLFESEPRLQQVETIETHLLRALAACKNLPIVADVRVKGAIGVVQLHEQFMDKIALRERFIKEGVWIRPFKDIVYIMPPLVISPQELAQLTDIIYKVLVEWAKEKS